MQFEFTAPTKLMFGEGTFQQVGQVVAQYGKLALLVTGRSAMQKSGHLDRAVELLRSAGVEVVVYSEVASNPTVEIADQGAAVARESRCDVVIALGGGSAMDAAKAIAVAAPANLPIRHFMVAEDRGKTQPVGPETLPLVCVTSTAGTSSELTPFAVLTIPDLQQKSAIRSNYIHARVAIEDPELTYSLPADQTAATGIDVLCHALESYISNSATPVTDLMSQEAIRLVGRYLPDAVADGSDVEARRQMMLANTFAGYGLACCGATVMHGLEHPISAHYPDIAHGVGLAAALRPWARKLWPRMPERFGRIARLLGAEVEQFSQEQAAAQAEMALDALLRKVNLDVRLGALGVAADKLGEMAQDACRYMGVALEKTPGGMDCSDVQELLEAAF